MLPILYVLAMSLLVQIWAAPAPSFIAHDLSPQDAAERWHMAQLVLSMMVVLVTLNLTKKGLRWATKF